MNIEEDTVLAFVDKSIEELSYNITSEISEQNMAYYITLGETRLNEIRNELQKELDECKDDIIKINHQIDSFNFENINNYNYACERYSKFITKNDDINKHPRVIDLYEKYKMDCDMLKKMEQNKLDNIILFNSKVRETVEIYNYLVNKLYLYSLHGDVSISEIKPFDINLNL